MIWYYVPEIFSKHQPIDSFAACTYLCMIALNAIFNYFGWEKLGHGFLCITLNYYYQLSVCLSSVMLVLI